jgi:hypothetical protein
MSATNYRLFLLSGLVAAVAASAAGCEITKIDCDKTPEEDICQDDPEEDGGDEWPDEDGGNADAGKTDAGVDGGKTDAGLDGGKTDAAVDGGSTDAGIDGSTDGSTDAAASTLTIDEFCIAQLKVAVTWRDGLEAACTSATLTDRETFLLEVLAYQKDDAEGKCVTARKAAVDSGNTTFDGTKAQACADAFTKNFDAPPDPFPSAGIDLAMYEANVAHGAPTLVQIPECRATFKGKLARGKVCTDNFECADGLRCLTAPGNTKACETALVGGTCTQTSNCADGYTCVGAENVGGGRTCVKNDALPLSGGNCQFSLECDKGLNCNASGKCANPVAQVICKP